MSNSRIINDVSDNGGQQYEAPAPQSQWRGKISDYNDISNCHVEIQEPAHVEEKERKKLLIMVKSLCLLEKALKGTQMKLG